MPLLGITIRRAKSSDAKGLYEVTKAGVNGNWSYTGTNKNSLGDIKKWKKILVEKNSNSYVFVAIEKSSDKIVGSASFSFAPKKRYSHVADFGWGVHPDYQRRGIGFALLKEALAFAKKKGFKRAEAEVAIENIASYKIAARCGFEVEGTKKKALLTDDGRYIDTYIMGKLF